MLSDDVVLSVPTSLPHGGEFTGPTEFDAFLARVIEGGAGASSALTVKRVIDAGEQVIAQFGAEATGSATGESVSTDSAWVFDVSSGRIVRAQVYADTAAGAHAAG